MELLSLYWGMLRDPSVPSNRIVRKTAVLTAALIFALAYYRHIILGFGPGEPLLVTLGLSFMLFAVVGILGGALAGSFYDAFRRDVAAQREKLTIAVFFVEWLFAVAAPVLGLVMWGSVGSLMP